MTEFSHSLEVYPTSETGSNAAILQVIASYLAPYRPSWVSVTCSNRHLSLDATLRLASEIQRELGIEAVPHLTGRGRTADDIRRLLDRAGESGIKRIVALRGDDAARRDDQFHTGADLIRFVKEYAPQFAVGASCYPAGHPESDTPQQDWQALKARVEAGADFFVSQFTLTPGVLWAFMHGFKKLGIHRPLYAGVLEQCPQKRVLSLAERCGVEVPPWEHTAELRSFISLEARVSGTSGLHIYTLNQPFDDS